MKAVLIRVAIVLFIRWLKNNEDMFKNKGEGGLLNRIFAASTHKELITAFEHKDTEKFIENVVTDIEKETISNVISGILGD